MYGQVHRLQLIWKQGKFKLWNDPCSYLLDTMSVVLNLDSILTLIPLLMSVKNISEGEETLI
jgi:hypothetical protein